MEKKKVKLGVRAKMMIFILPIVAMSFVLLILIAFFSSRTSIHEKTENLLEAEGKASANDILAWQNHNLGTLDDMVNTILNLHMKDEEILNYEAFYLETYEDFPNGIYIVCSNGDVIDATGWTPEGDITEKAYYKEGVNHEKFAFGEPYIDGLTNEYVVTASRHLPDLGGREAVAAADVNLNILSETVEKMQVAGDGDAFIIDGKDGIILAHKDDEIVGVSVEEIKDSFYSTIFKQITAGNTATASYASDNGKYIVSIQPIVGTEWYIVSRALESKVYKDIYLLGVILLGVGIVVLTVLSVLLVVQISRITRPIHKLTDTIVTVTNGDFTTDIEVKGNDEITVMAVNMKQFLHVMRETLGDIVRISDEIDEQANGSNQISGELYESANGQAESMTQMRVNLEELVKSITDIADNATKLALVVAETDEEGKRVLENFQNTMHEADTGRNSMESVTTSMNEMEEDMGLLETSITEVGAATEKIDEITATIRSIAGQTNLLALNASIEAARAGEAGKGFAVVATEIKQLAETSGNAVDEISELISSVTGLINQTVEQSHSSMDRIHESAKLVYSASSQFHNIFESIEKTNDIVKEIILKINEVNDVSTNMAAITQEQSASAEEIEATAANIQELSNIVTDNSATMKKDSTDLAQTADTLKEHISKFKI